MTPRDFQAHRTQLCNVPGCDCSCPNCRVPPLGGHHKPHGLAEYLMSGVVLLFVVVAFGLLLWALA